MSLESKFAALTIDDASSIVAAVKADGVSKSGLADGIGALAAKCASKDETEALAAFATVKALAEECPEAQAFTKDCLSACKFAENLVGRSFALEFEWFFWEILCV